MKTWIFVISTLFVQEATSTNAAIYLIRDQHLNLWIINIIWILATAIDILVGYALGKWMQRRLKKTKLIKWSEGWTKRIEDFIGRSGECFVIIFLGVINFPYLNSFLMSGIRFSFKNIFIFTFIGEAIFWGIEWLINISANRYFSDPHTVLYIVIGFGLLFSVVSKMVLTKVVKSSNQAHIDESSYL